MRFNKETLLKGLIIAEPWITKILNGEKTWEIRSKNCKIRGQIGLIRKGSGQVVGSARVVDCLGPMPVSDLLKHQDKHGATRADFAAIGYTEAYAWVLADVKRFKQPRRYTHKSGAVTWVDLSGVDISLD